MELKNDIVPQLKDQNYWLSERNFEIEYIYSLNTDKKAYKIIILSCKTKLQKEFIGKKFVIFRMKESECYEYFNIMSVRFGHMDILYLIAAYYGDARNMTQLIVLKNNRLFFIYGILNELM